VKYLIPLWLLLSVFLVSWEVSPEDGLFYQPDGWPKPSYNFETNPISHEGFLLGKALFYDPLLSKDSTVCSTPPLRMWITQQVMGLILGLENATPLG